MRPDGIAVPCKDCRRMIFDDRFPLFRDRAPARSAVIVRRYRPPWRVQRRIRTRLGALRIAASPMTMAMQTGGNLP